MAAVSPALSRDNPTAIRAFTERDYGAVAELYIQHDLEFIGSSNFSEQFLREDWDLPAFDPLTDVCVAERPDGTLAGVMTCYAIRPIPARPILFGYAAPDGRDAVSAKLVAWGVARGRQVLARVPDGIRVVLEASVHRDNAGLVGALRQAGFTSERSTYTMLIRFDGPIAPPVFPDGLRVVTFADRPDIPLLAATVKAAFADHRGASADTSLDYYIGRYERDVKQPDFDPSAWWLVMDGETPAAVAITYQESDEYPNVAYVHQLGTVPAYRRRGIAQALLQTIFSEFQRRGRDGVSLGVDSSSLTNAVALYERAGMHIAVQWDAYELELRPGIEHTRQ